MIEPEKLCVRVEDCLVDLKVVELRNSKTVLVLTVSYLGSIIFAAVLCFILSSPSDEWLMRTGAAIIIFSTFVTGFHLISLRRDMEKEGLMSLRMVQGFGAGNSGFGLSQPSLVPGANCESCHWFADRLEKTKAKTSKRFSLVIIIETFLLCVATFFWGFGDWILNLSKCGNLTC